MSGKAPYLSLIVPVYNESDRLIPGLAEISSYLSQQPYTWEVILVDDGSKIPAIQTVKQAMNDGLIPKLNFKTTLRVVRLDSNRGKGAAIGKGVAESRGYVVVFCDIDMSVPMQTLVLMLKKLKQFPVVITSRRLHDSRIAVHQKQVRELSGRVFTAVSNIVCGTRIADVTCGFKGFSREAAMLLFGKQKIHRWVFDSELLFLARKYKLDVRQIAVVWSNKPGSKVRPLDSIRSLADLVKIRWFDITGQYGI